MEVGGNTGSVIEADIPSNGEGRWSNAGRSPMGRSGVWDVAAVRDPRLASRRWRAKAVVITLPSCWRAYSLGVGVVYE